MFFQHEYFLTLRQVNVFYEDKNIRCDLVTPTNVEHAATDSVWTGAEFNPRPSQTKHLTTAYMDALRDIMKMAQWLVGWFTEEGYCVDVSAAWYTRGRAL